MSVDLAQLDGILDLLVEHVVRELASETDSQKENARDPAKEFAGAQELLHADDDPARATAQGSSAEALGSPALP